MGGKIEPRTYQMAGGKWPFRDVMTRGGYAHSGIIAITAPMNNPADRDEFARLRDQARYFVGMSSYQQFPGRLHNPANNANDCRPFFDAPPPGVAERLIGWLDCSRDPAAVGIPAALEPLEFSESDLCRDDLIQSARDHAKRWDFLFYVPTNQYSDYCRNLHNAKRWIRRMCGGPKHRLTMLVIGREPDDMYDLLDLTVGSSYPDDDDDNGNGRRRPIETRPLMGHYQFLELMKQCRYLFLPNIADASPRVFAEAQLHDLPALANRNIHGGWKYFGPRVGETFDGDADFDAALDRFLANARAGNVYAPRAAYTERYGFTKARPRLFEYLMRRRLAFRERRASLYGNLRRIWVIAASDDDEARRWRELGAHLVDSALVEMSPTVRDCDAAIAEWRASTPAQTDAGADEPGADDRRTGRVVIVHPTFAFPDNPATLRRACSALINAHCNQPIARTLVRWDLRSFDTQLNRINHTTRLYPELKK